MTRQAAGCAADRPQTTRAARRNARCLRRRVRSHSRVAAWSVQAWPRSLPLRVHNLAGGGRSQRGPDHRGDRRGRLFGRGASRSSERPARDDFAGTWTRPTRTRLRTSQPSRTGDRQRWQCGSRSFRLTSNRVAGNQTMIQETPAIGPPNDEKSVSELPRRMSPFIRAAGMQLSLTFSMFLILDNGIVAFVFIRASVAYWAGVLFMVARRRDSLTPMDQAYLEYGQWVALLISIPIASQLTDMVGPGGEMFLRKAIGLL